LRGLYVDFLILETVPGIVFENLTLLTFTRTRITPEPIGTAQWMIEIAHKHGLPVLSVVEMYDPLGHFMYFE